jgi:hypothetical protein
MIFLNLSGFQPWNYSKTGLSYNITGRKEGGSYHVQATTLVYSSRHCFSSLWFACLVAFGNASRHPHTCVWNISRRSIR